MMQVLVKAPLCQSLLGTRAGLPVRERLYIHAGKAASNTMLRARREAVSEEEMVVRSALTTLQWISTMYMFNQTMATLTQEHMPA